MCAVPSGTPTDPQGVRLIPSAGPYRVASYAPGQGVELTRNPNYHGSRPHRLERIDLRVGISDQRAVAQVEAGTADYLVDGGVPAADATRLAARYGPGSPAAKNGRQQYFVKAGPQLDFFRSEHPPSAVRRRTATASSQLRDQPRRASPPRRRVHAAAARTSHRPLPAARHSRVPQRAALPLQPGPGQGETARQRARQENRRALHLQRLAMRPAGADRQDQSGEDRYPGRRQSLHGLDPVHQDRHAWRTVRHRLPRLATGLPGSERLPERAARGRHDHSQPSTTRPTAHGSPARHGSPAPSAT